MRRQLFQCNSDYVETSVTSYNSSSLTLDHSGAYVAKYFVTWDEVKYENGKEIVEQKQWDGNGKARTAH